MIRRVHLKFGFGWSTRRVFLLLAVWLDLASVGRIVQQQSGQPAIAIAGMGRRVAGAYQLLYIMTLWVAKLHPK